MPTDRTRYLPLALAFGLALTTLVPYLLASSLAPNGWHFAGILLNPYDGFSYLAKMRQGLRGEWLFTLPYAAQPGEGAFIFTFYLLLGHVARWLNAQLAIVFHGARMGSLLLMAYLLFRWFSATLANRSEAISALGLCLFGAGIGWITGPLGLESSDLFIPESIPFQASLVNPHFPLATGLVAAAATLAIRGGNWRSLSLGMGVGFLLSMILPFALFPLMGSLVIWLGVEWWLSRGRRGHTDMKAHVFPILGLALGATPLVLYDAWISLSHPVLMIWSRQNLTPSPHPLGYLSGFGIILLAGLMGIVRSSPHTSRDGRLLLTWLLVGGAMLYLPFGLQRRLSLGLMIPITTLAVRGVRNLGRGPSRFLPAMLVLALPSNLLVSAAGLVQVARADQQLLLTTAEHQGYLVLAEEVEAGSLLLAAPETGNRLPAYAHVRVLYGHPFETPDAERMRHEVISLLGDLGSEYSLQRMEELGIDYVVLGPHERRIGARSEDLALDPVVGLPGFDLLALTER